MSNFLTGSLLRKLREESNYSLQDIANYLGVSKPAVSKWENGYDIKTENLYSLAKLYGVKSPDIMRGKFQFMYSIRVPKAVSVYTKGDN